MGHWGYNPTLRGYSSNYEGFLGPPCMCRRPPFSFFCFVHLTFLKKNMETSSQSKQNMIGYNWNDVDDVENDEDILGYCNDLG